MPDPSESGHVRLVGAVAGVGSGKFVYVSSKSYMFFISPPILGLTKVFCALKFVLLPSLKYRIGRGRAWVRFCSVSPSIS